MTDTRSAQWFLERFPADEVLRSALAGDPVTRLLGVARTRAIVVATPDLVPIADDAATRAALELATRTAKRIAQEGPAAVITDEEKAALDLFILLVARPSILVREGDVTDSPENWREIRRDRELIREVISGVGRLQLAGGAPKGTGFLVAERCILTNNHVVCALLGMPLEEWKSDPALYDERCTQANTRWATDPSTAPLFELRAEFGSAATAAVRVRSIRGHHLTVDMAVLDLEADPPGSMHLPLSRTEPASFQSRRVYAVGYPLQARATPIHVFNSVFGTDPRSLGTKRLSPGLVTDWSGGDQFAHDASTLGGSSGSAIVDFEDRHVVGLHFAGAYEVNNYAVPLFKFRNDPLLAGIA